MIRKKLSKLLKHDKKNIGDKINFVLISSIGKPKIDVQVPEDLFERCIQFLFIRLGRIPACIYISKKRSRYNSL